MKKLLVIMLSLLAASSVFAQYPGHNHRHHGGWGYGWVAPTIIGGVVGYEIARSQQPVIVQQPVVVQPQTMIVPSPAPAGFHWEQIRDANCNCYRMVLVQG